MTSMVSTLSASTCSAFVWNGNPGDSQEKTGSDPSCGNKMFKAFRRAVKNKLPSSKHTAWARATDSGKMSYRRRALSRGYAAGTKQRVDNTVSVLRDKVAKSAAAITALEVKLAPRGAELELAACRALCELKDEDLKAERALSQAQSDTIKRMHASLVGALQAMAAANNVHAGLHASVRQQLAHIKCLVGIIRSLS